MSFGILASNFFWFFTTKNHFIDSNWCIDFTQKRHSGVYKMSFGILAPNFFWFFTTKNHFIDCNWCIDFTKTTLRSL